MMRLLLLPCLAQVVLLLGSPVSGAHWGYDAANGPATWAATYPTCGGSAQSPINIDSVIVTRHPRPEWQGYEYTPKTMSVTNNGHSLSLSGNTIGNASTPLLALGYDKVYALDSVHFHWGKNNAEGSEHTFLGRRYPLEMHAVHKRVDVTGQIASPLDIVVVANLFQVSEQRNLAFDSFLSAASLVKEAGASANVRPFAWSSLIHEFHERFYVYRGSLTTPPCTEAVTFFIRDKLYKVSPSQLEQLRTLLNEEKEEISCNFRPVQPKNGRNVYYVLH